MNPRRDINPPELDGRQVLVVGLGLTGLALARFLAGRGALVSVTDSSDSEAVRARAGELAEIGVRVETGGHGSGLFESADLIVLSPGVPPTIEPLAKTRDRGVEVTGEIELASRFTNAPMIAVTGTNGKTTTTSLIGHILRAAGREAFVGGNIGDPLIGFVTSEAKADFLVVELSSFQLETARTLRPDAAVLLNVTPDHLDRYAGFAEYRDAKYRIFSQQEPGDAAVVNGDDPVALAAPSRGKKLVFSRLAPVEEGAFIDRGDIVVRLDGGDRVRMAADRLALVGAHNQENVMAALLAVSSLGLDPRAALEAASQFQGLPHRVELVGEFGGVRYYDDSKGTNVGAVIKSLEGFDAPVILIAGGRDKEGDFTALGPLVAGKVKRLVLIGEAAEKIRAAVGEKTDTVLAGDMLEAVSLARESAVPGDVVLLSPACASFDMFDSYAHRGRVFAETVRKAAQ